MKKTVYSKSFKGWANSSDTAKRAFQFENMPDDNPIILYDEKEDCEADFYPSKRIKPVRVKITFAVTMEPI